ncbi:MAG: protein kinase domain-containing protein [Caldimonas sp.]
MSIPPELWAEISRLLDEAMSLDSDARAAWLPRLDATAADIAAHVRRLIAAHDRADGSDALEAPPAELVAAAFACSGDAPPLAPGTMLGPYRLVERIGEGGMASVWLAEQTLNVVRRVALKIPHAGLEDAAAMTARFAHERDFLAGLEHPHIARLYDAGASESGLPYLAMEWIDGVPITRFADERRLAVAPRIALFLQALQAVRHAHARLIIHRDLKPSNIIVTADGQVKLLDFGIARLLEDALNGEAPAGVGVPRALTPQAASPEQLAGEPLGTTSDIYSLGVVLYELLTGRRPYQLASGDGSATALHSALIAIEIGPPSEAAIDVDAAGKRGTTPAGLRRGLAGDLDAITGKALMKDAALRYESAEAMAADLERHLRHEPVLARRGGWGYVAGRALRRHRTWAGASAVALLAIAVGMGGVVWQARVARREADRATSVKNFLLQVFRASDPRIPSDKPRGQITARELLDAGSTRIDAEFAGQPDLQIEMLGVVGSLHRELNESERQRAVTARRLVLAGSMPGRYPQVPIEALLDEANAALVVPDRKAAGAALDRADALIRSAGLDESRLRATWWMQRARAEPAKDLEAQQRELEQSLALYRRIAPRDPGYVRALAQLGGVAFYGGRYETAVGQLREAVAAAAQADERMDGEMIEVWGNIGTANVVMGKLDDASAAFEQAIQLAARTYGTGHPEFWRLASQNAALLHMMGQRDAGIERFEALRRLVPDPPTNSAGWTVLTDYAGRLAAQGEPERAVAWMEGAERFEQQHPTAPFALRRLRLLLGNIYSLVGRRDDARHLLQASFDEYVANDSVDSQARMGASERWARILLEDGRSDEARRLFEQVVAADKGRNFTATALAQAGLARVELSLGHANAAVPLSAAAVERWHAVKGYRDVRAGPVILRVQARALLAAGDAVGAKAVAADALAQSLRYDAPAAASIAEARDLLRRADASLQAAR